MPKGTLHIAVPRERFDPLQRAGWKAVVAAAEDAGWQRDRDPFTAPQDFAVVYEGKPNVPYLYSQGW